MDALHLSDATRVGVDGALKRAEGEYKEYINGMCPHWRRSEQVKGRFVRSLAHAAKYTLSEPVRYKCTRCNRETDGILSCRCAQVADTFRRKRNPRLFQICLAGCVLAATVLLRR